MFVVPPIFCRNILAVHKRTMQKEIAHSRDWNLNFCFSHSLSLLFPCVKRSYNGSFFHEYVFGTLLAKWFIRLKKISNILIICSRNMGIYFKQMLTVPAYKSTFLRTWSRTASHCPLSTRASTKSSSCTVSLMFHLSFPLQAMTARAEKYDAACCALSQSLEENNLLLSAARTDFKFKATTAGSHLFPVCSPSTSGDTL